MYNLDVKSVRINIIFKRFMKQKRCYANDDFSKFFCGFKLEMQSQFLRCILDFDIDMYT